MTEIRSLRKFSCDPKIYCKKALCCRQSNFVPALTLGDYVRISGALNMDLKEFWQQRGAVAAAFRPDFKPHVYPVSLSVIFHPCTFLDTVKNLCEVHPARPLVCASFPAVLFDTEMTSPEYLELMAPHYDCLRGAYATADQIDRSRKLKQISLGEQTWEWRLFPRDFHSVHAPGTSFFKLAGEALGLQRARDPNGRLERTAVLFEAVNEMRRILSEEKPETFTLDVYLRLLSPVLFSIFQDKVSDVLENLDGQLIKSFLENGKLYSELQEGL